MYTYHYMWAPSLENLKDVTYASLLEKLTSFRTKPVYAPIEILHPVLPVTEQPVI
jgi:hypothetical protein